MREVSGSIGLEGVLWAIALRVGYLLSKKLQPTHLTTLLLWTEPAKVHSKKRELLSAEKMGDDELGLINDAFNQMLPKSISLIRPRNTRLREKAEIESTNMKLRMRSRSEELKNRPCLGWKRGLL